MSIGIKNAFRLAASQAVTNSAVLVAVPSLSNAIAAGQIMHLRWYLAFSVGAAGGIRLQITTPAGIASFGNSILLVNTVAPATVPAFQTSSVVFNNALANAGNHFMYMETDIVNGATAGRIGLSIAQDTANATPVNLFMGSWLETTVGPF